MEPLDLTGCSKPEDFVEKCRERFERFFGKDEKVFRGLVEYAQVGYGIHVEGSDGAQLFAYNVLPKAVHLKQYLGTSCTSERLKSFFLDFHRSKMWDDDLTLPLVNLALMVTIRNGYEHFDDQKDPFSVSLSSIAVIERFSLLLGVEGRLLPAWQMLRQWQLDASRDGLIGLSALELLTIEMLMIETRKVSYMAKTWSVFNWHSIQNLLDGLVIKAKTFENTFKLSVILDGKPIEAHHRLVLFNALKPSNF